MPHVYPVASNPITSPPPWLSLKSKNPCSLKLCNRKGAKEVEAWSKWKGRSRYPAEEYTGYGLVDPRAWILDPSLALVIVIVVIVIIIFIIIVIVTIITIVISDISIKVIGTTATQPRLIVIFIVIVFTTGMITMIGAVFTVIIVFFPCRGVQLSKFSRFVYIYFIDFKPCL